MVGCCVIPWFGCSSSNGAHPDAGGSPGPGPGSDAAVAIDAPSAPPSPPQVMSTTVDTGVTATPVTINEGTSIGKGAGSTPMTLGNLAQDPANSQTVVSAVEPFNATGKVPDTAAGFCAYPASGAPTRMTYPSVAGTTDPQVAMAPFYFPFVYYTPNTTTGNAVGGQPPLIGLFDWRPSNIDEALVVAESDDLGKTWYFMQSVLELHPDYSNPTSGGFTQGSTDTGCPTAVTSDNSALASANGSTADDGWGHASIIQLPGQPASTGQFLYMLDRKPASVDVAPLQVINLVASSNKFPIWNTNKATNGATTTVGLNDIRSISSALTNTTGAVQPVVVQQTVGLMNPDGIIGVFPTAPTAPAGAPVTILYVQKILDGDDTGATALPAAQQCQKAPFSGKLNHDLVHVRLATTTDGIHFTDGGVVEGLNDPTTVDFGGTRWVSPRGSLVDIKGDGSVWGLYFAGGNCLDGDSDAFHYIGYAESTDKLHWKVFNDINHPIVSINKITTTQNNASVTVPANAPLVPTQAWFAQRVYSPTAVQIDATHLSLTFAGYGVQSPKNDLLDYRQIGNVKLTVNKSLPAGVPNNINAH
jgi:hypothetical protein